MRIHPAENPGGLHFVHMHPSTIEDDACDQHRPVDRAWIVVLLTGYEMCLVSISCLSVLSRVLLTIGLMSGADGPPGACAAFPSTARPSANPNEAHRPDGEGLEFLARSHQTLSVSYFTFSPFFPLYRWVCLRHAQSDCSIVRLFVCAMPTWSVVTAKSSPSSRPSSSACRW